METKNITVRIPAEMYDRLQKNADNPKMDVGSINQQIVEALRKLDTLERLSMEELRGKFTTQEWACMAEMMNATRATEDFRYRTFSIIAEIEDSELYEGTCSKWKVDQQALIAKCKKLTAAQMDALYRRIEYYWLNSDINTDVLKWGEY